MLFNEREFYHPGEVDLGHFQEDLVHALSLNFLLPASPDQFSDLLTHAPPTQQLNAGDYSMPSPSVASSDTSELFWQQEHASEAPALTLTPAPVIAHFTHDYPIIPDYDAARAGGASSVHDLDATISDVSSIQDDESISSDQRHNQSQQLALMEAP